MSSRGVPEPWPHLVLCFGARLAKLLAEVTGLGKGGAERLLSTCRPEEKTDKHPRAYLFSSCKVSFSRTSS